MYLNVIELAESLGVEEGVVEGWVRNEGLPCVTDRGRLLFDRAQVVTWAASKGLAAKAGFLTVPAGLRREERGLEPLLRRGGIWRDVPPTTTVAVLAEVVSRLPGVSPPVQKLLQQRLHAAGGISWAPVGSGFALPHLRTPVALGREAGILAILLLQGAIEVGEPVPDEQPITRLLYFIAPSPRAHLEFLGQLSAALTRGGLRRLLVEKAPDAEIYAALGATGVGAKREGSG